MSSQGINSTDYSGFYLAPIDGRPGGFPVRNASDYTSYLKQIKAFSVLSGSFPLIQSNDARLEYRRGQVNCGCTGPFPTQIP